MRTAISKGMLAATALICYGMAGAQVAKQGNGYLFRMKYSPGQVITFAVKSAGQVSQRSFTSQMSISQKITKVEKDIATIQATLSDATVVMNGKSMTQPIPESMKNITVQMDRQGHVKGGGATGQQTSIAYPDKPIKIGTSWTANTTVGGSGQSMQVTATYKFVGVENLAGKNAAKVTISLKGTGQMAISGGGTSWISLSDGWMLKSNTSMTMNMGGMTIPMTVTLVRK